MKLVNRSEAHSLGLRQYYTGRPCKHNHINYRYVSTGSCVDCVAMRRSKYHNPQLFGVTVDLYHADDVATIKRMAAALNQARELDAISRGVHVDTL